MAERAVKKLRYYCQNINSHHYLLSGVSHVRFIDCLKLCAAAKLFPARTPVSAKLVKTALLNKVAQEASCCFVVHATAAYVAFVLFFTDCPDFRITCLRMHEYEAADAGIRSHGIAFGHLDSQGAACELMLVSMAVLVAMTVALAAAAAVVVMHLSAFSKKFKYILF